jgi:hypothetical protein
LYIPKRLNWYGPFRLGSYFTWRYWANFFYLFHNKVWKILLKMPH